MKYAYEVQQYYGEWLHPFVVASSIKIAMKHARGIDYGSVRVLRRTLNKTMSEANHSKLMWEAFKGTDGKWRIHHSVPERELT